MFRKCVKQLEKHSKEDGDGPADPASAAATRMEQDEEAFWKLVRETEEEVPLLNNAGSAVYLPCDLLIQTQNIHLLNMKMENWNLQKTNEKSLPPTVLQLWREIERYIGALVFFSIMNIIFILT